MIFGQKSIRFKNVIFEHLKISNHQSVYKIQPHIIKL